MSNDTYYLAWTYNKSHIEVEEGGSGILQINYQDILASNGIVLYFHFFLLNWS